MNHQAARNFIISNARPLERALYNYHFENGTKEAVLAKLKQYQNPDGGFGHGLEADNWNPNSNPISTNDAILILHRIHALEDAGSMTEGIVRYLQSHDSFDEEKKRWMFAIETNKNYPHAIWWEKKGDGLDGYNPTVSLAAFLVCFGGHTSYYKNIVKSAYADLRENTGISSDGIKCYLLGYELLKEKGITDVVDMGDFRQLIKERMEAALCRDPEKYGVEYVAAPSDFFSDPHPEFMSDGIRTLIAAEKNVLSQLQKEDGGFDITWQWYTPYAEFEQARRWWRPRITMDKLLFSQNHSHDAGRCFADRVEMRQGLS